MSRTRPFSHAWTLLVGAVGLLLVSNVAWYLQFRSQYVAGKVLAARPVAPDFFAARNTQLSNETGAPIVILFGDSRVAQWDPEPDLDDRARVVNRGRPGETTAQMRARFAADVIELDPAVVVIQAGINDLVAAGLAGEAVRREIVAASVDNLAAFAREAAAAGIDVVLTKVVPPAPPPLYRRPFWNDAIPDLVAEVNAALDATAFGPEVTVLDISEPLLATTGEWLPDMAEDTLHFTPAAYGRINEVLAPTLQAATSDAVQ